MHIVCPHCRASVEVGDHTAREVSCPSCGSVFRLAHDSTIEVARTPGRIGRFEVLSTLGLGAFGTVYKVRDTDLDRIVALKVPRAGSLGDAEQTSRFLREARSVAQLRHPHIVPVHEAGQSDGLPYLVSDYIDGVTLADQLTARKPAFRDAAALIATVAEALAYAHSQGVVHRDIKPSNVMLDRTGKPFLMDFGLARRDAGEVTMTAEGTILGTPAYMSPEQARGEAHTADARSDVYSLGVVLYEVLTGELPFRGNQRMLLLQVIQDEPKSLRSLNDRIPRDLETICLKAMAKEPAKRYPTAGELADDLRRWLGGEAIKARPVGRLEKMARWCRRHPTAAGLIAASVLLVLLIGGGSVLAVAAWQIAAARDDLALANRDLQSIKQGLVDTNRELEGARGRAEDLLVKLYVANGNDALADQDLFASLPWFVEALRVDRGDAAFHRARVACLLRASPRLLHQFRHEGHAHFLYFSPDGRRLLLTDAKGASLWDLSRDPPTRLALESASKQDLALISRDGRRVLTLPSDHGPARLWDPATGKELALLRHSHVIVNGDFNPNGKSVATADRGGGVRLWDAVTGRPIGQPRKFPDLTSVANVTFSPDGDYLAVGELDNAAWLWHLPSGDTFGPLKHESWVEKVEWSPEGKRFLTISVNTLRIWDRETITPVVTIQSAQAMQDALFSPDGKTLLVAADHGGRFYKAQDGDVPAEAQSALTTRHSGAFRRSSEQAQAWRGRQAVEAVADRHWTAAAFHLARLLAAGPPDPSLLLQRARAHRGLGDYRQALADPAQEGD